MREEFFENVFVFWNFVLSNYKLIFWCEVECLLLNLFFDDYVYVFLLILLEVLLIE